MRFVSTGRQQVSLGYAAAIASALSYALGGLVAKKAVVDTSALVATAFSLLFGTLVLAALLNRLPLGDLARAPRRAWGIMALAGVTGAWGVTFFFLALGEAPLVLVAPVAGVYPLISILLAHLLLQRIERVTWPTVLGAGLVVGGVALIAVGRG